MTRAAAVIAALAVCGWFALSARQATSTRDAQQVLSALKRPTPQQAARATTLLDHARTLNPDHEIDLLKGRLALAEGDRARARTILTRAAADEPDNVYAWTDLAFAVANDPAAVARATVQIRRLAPRVPAP